MPSLEIRSRPGVRWYWAPDGQQEARRFSGYRGGSPRAHVLASDPGADVPGEKTRKQDAAHAEESADLKTGTFLSVSDSLPAAFAARSISARNCNTATCDIVSARREERGSARFVLTGELSFFFFFFSLHRIRRGLVLVAGSRSPRGSAPYRLRRRSVSGPWILRAETMHRWPARVLAVNSAICGPDAQVRWKWLAAAARARNVSRLFLICMISRCRAPPEIPPLTCCERARPLPGGRRQ